MNTLFLNGESFTIVPAVVTEKDCLCLCYDLKEAPEAIQSLPNGDYEVNGEKFRIEKGPFSNHIAFELFSKEHTNQMIEQWISDEMDRKYPEPKGEVEEEFEVSCSSCKDGGCVHCRPNLFL